MLSSHSKSDIYCLWVAVLQRADIRKTVDANFFGNAKMLYSYLLIFRKYKNTIFHVYINKQTAEMEEHKYLNVQ